ncbi:MAG: PqiC family protein [Thermodesulfobacteriota bacterium]
MKGWWRQRLALALVLIFAALLASCAARPETKLYLLSPLAPDTPTAEGAGQTMVIGLGPVTLPDYLDRPQIVFRVSANRLTAADTHRWAEPLSANVARVLAENLAAQLPGSRILHYPWAGSEAPDYQVRVEVLRFDAGPDEAVHLSASWSVNGGQAAPRRADISVAAPAHDFEALVRAESQALFHLSREIADELRRLTTGR